MDHSEAADFVELEVSKALEHLYQAAKMLRGPHIDASPDAMRLETTISRAIESITTQGFSVPPREK